MPTTKLLSAALGLAAVLGAGAAGWFLLDPGPPPAPSGSPTVVPTGEPGVPPAPKPVSTEPGPKAVDVDDPDDERDIDGSDPTGGPTAEEIYAAAVKGDWQLLEQLLSVAGTDDPRMTQFLLDKMQDGQYRNWAASLARHLKDPAALARFLELAKTPGDDATRCAALMASAHIGGAGVFEAAAEALKTARPGGMLFASAANALGTLGSAEATHTLLDLLRSSAGTSRLPVMVGALSLIRSPEGLAEIGRLANDGAQEAGFREALVAALGRTREASVVPDLLKAARESDSEAVRGAAYTALALVGDPEGVRELVGLVHSGDDAQKVQAAMALQNVRNRESAGILEEALARPMPDQLLPHVIEALGQIGAKTSIEPLSLLLKAESEGTRVVAVRALGRIGDPSSGKVILDALDAAPRTDAAFRREAIAALVGTSTVRDLPRLEKMMAETGQDQFEWFLLRPAVDRLKRERDKAK
jgi:HEAT repeat protein